MVINARLKKSLISAFGSGEKSRDGVNFAVSCPVCNDSRKEKKKLVIRLDDARYHCWVCGTKGKNIRWLVKKYRPGFIHLFGGFSSNKVKELEIPPVNLPKDFIHLASYRGKDPDIKSVISYLKRRGLKKMDLYRWRLLSCRVGQHKRRVIVPSFDYSGELNYYVARTIDDSVKPKYRNARAKKNDVIFNEIDISWKNPIILVEGIFDAIKSPENSIPLLGSTLSKNSSLYKRLAANESTVYLSLDPDMKDKAYLIANNLSAAGCNVFMSFAPRGKDLGDMPREEVKSLLESSRSYSRNDSLSYAISKIKSGSMF